MSRRYTKAHLEEVVNMQFENLNAIHDLISIMKHQNELVKSANKKLRDEISDFKKQLYPKMERRKKDERENEGVVLSSEGRVLRGERRGGRNEG